ncbi:MAG: hypothetical protein KJ906_00845 [Nanoarchaeota archaeon]|nr:hypothetical protein [Nanoarchaeota archaeon]
MKIGYLVPVIAIMLIVSVSGCIDGFDLSMLGFGGNQPSEVASPDLIVMSDISVPQSLPILAENEFTVMFKIKNMDEETINDVKIKLYDWGICTPIVEEFLPVDVNAGWEGLPDSTKPNYYLRTIGEFYQNSEEVIEFRFESPNNDRLANIPTVCPVKWEINYTSSAKTNDDFTVISKARNDELQKSGTPSQITNQPQFVGIGPVKIIHTFKTPMPAQSNSSISFTLQIFDEGSGIYSQVEAGTMFLKVPVEWVSDDFEEATKACTGTFELLTTETAISGGISSGVTANVIANLQNENGYVVYRNTIPIKLYNRETHKISCRFKAPDLDSQDTPEKTYFLSANITDYSYRITGTKSVRIEPMV